MWGCLAAFGKRARVIRSFLNYEASMIAFILFIFATSADVQSSSNVAMVFSLSRHGARNVLKKNAFLDDSDSFGGD